MVLSPSNTSTGRDFTRLEYFYRGSDSVVNNADREETIQKFAQACLIANSTKAIRAVEPYTGGFAILYVSINLSTIQDRIYTQQLSALATLRDIWQAVIQPAGDMAKNVFNDIKKQILLFPKWFVPVVVIAGALWLYKEFK